MIYVSGRYLLQDLTGVNRFAYEICKAWTQMGVQFTLLCPPGDIKQCYDIAQFNILVCGWGKSHIWEQMSLPLYFNRIKGEKILVCFTGLGPLLVCKKIMTIHDLAFMAEPKWYSPSYRIWYRLMTPLCATTAKKILTVSKFSKSEIIYRLSINANKICVVYNAVSSRFFVSDNVCRERFIHAEEKYILAVSSIDPRKNFSMLLNAFARMKDKSIKLYIVGGQASIYSTSINELRNDIHTDRIVWLGRITDRELKIYYKNALCFVYPSLYEGFGIPPLEAMACGTPTIVSDIPVLREVCGDASLYIQPLDAQDIIEKIMLLVGDNNLRKNLREAGYKQCKQFAWKNSAKLVYDLLCNIKSNE